MAINFFKIARGLFLAPQTTTPASPADGDVYYDLTSNAFQFRENGSWKALGSGQGGINYITNGQADTGVAGWSSYADAAGAAPVDGTGGSPAITFTASPTSPLRGSASFVLSKPAANRQGQGVAYDFAIAEADLAKPLTISFEYFPTANFEPGSTLPDLSDIVIYIYDVDNARLIQPSQFILGGGSETPNKYSAQFQTASDSLNYRLIFHIATTNALAYDFKFDTVSLGPETKAFGAPVTDWTRFTPTFTNVNLGAGGVAEGIYRRVGSDLEVRVSLRSGTGPSTSGPLSLSLPTGFQMDASPGGLLPDQRGYLGGAIYTDTGGASFNTIMGVERLSNTTVSFRRTDGTSFPQAGQFSTANETFQTTFTVPIIGWRSTVSLSQDTDTRVVAASYLSNDGASIGPSFAATQMILPDLGFDTHGAYNSATGVYTVPVSGIYRVSGRLASSGTTSNADLNVILRFNGADIRLAQEAEVVGTTGGYSPTVTYDWLIEAKAGDTIELIHFGNPATTVDTNTPARTVMNIQRLSGPSAIASSETVAAAGISTAAQLIPNVTEVVVNFNSTTFDTHGAITTGAGWNFRAPISGLYECSACVGFGGLVTQPQVVIRVNTVSVVGVVGAAGGDGFSSGVATHILKLNAGDEVDVTAYHASGSGVSLNSDPRLNFFSIKRIGL